ncbi:MAG: Gfo/Idh/MocA family oxidoreductase [Bacteroidales bacterium]|jgi:predicted dehydrogenase
MSDTRRDFLKKAVAGTVGLTVGNKILASTARSYRSISGANEVIRIAVIGCNSRGASMAGTFARQPNTEVIYICDVENVAMQKGIKSVEDVTGKEPESVRDFRKILENKNLDAVYIATPDHWHAPASILSLKAGKHVYVEKPLSHNPHEGEMLVSAAEKYKRIVQIGTQRRSWPTLTQGIEELKNGVIGKVYMAKTWYANTRGSIGIGKMVPVPSNLNYELWQGPAPRRPYKDNLIHYNWHWFWNWGTGEALNNGTHDIDVARWGLGLDYPHKVNSVGGRYQFKDDWETPDTQVITFETHDAIIIWEGRSCNGSYNDNRSRGVIFHGENGSLHTGDNSYMIYDNKNKLVKEVKSDIVISEGLNTTSPGEELDALHVQNFLENIRNNRKPFADALNGHKSTLWMQLGNISQRVGHTLNIDPSDGHIIDDNEAMKLWSREYENGWEPTV